MRHEYGAEASGEDPQPHETRSEGSSRRIVISGREPKLSRASFEVSSRDGKSELEVAMKER